jgi:hypothetical protein
MDPKVFVIQKFKNTGRERVNISNSFTCHCCLILCLFEFSLVLNENNLETLSFVLSVNGYVHSLEMVWQTVLSATPMAMSYKQVLYLVFS